MDRQLKVEYLNKQELQPYAEIVKTAREYIQKIGGFEKFAEWGLI